MGLVAFMLFPIACGAAVLAVRFFRLAQRFRGGIDPKIRLAVGALYLLAILLGAAALYLALIVWEILNYHF